MENIFLTQLNPQQIFGREVLKIHPFFDKEWVKSKVLIFLCLTLILLSASCSRKAKITSSWVDPALGGYGANNILVMGVSRSETRLKLYENVFVDLLAKNNVQAMASHKVIGNVLEPDEKIVEAAIKKTGASSVLITHVVDRKSETQTYPGAIHFQPGGYYRSMYGYYGQTYAAIYTPPSNVTRTIVRLESNLYDVATASLVWSAQSEAIDLKLLRTDFERIGGLLIADMKNNGVLK